jgi:5-methylcytosine-specific restriction endonuclease McrA
VTNSKACTKCKDVKELTEFYKSKVTKDSLHTWCKLCVKAHGKSKRQRVRKAKYMAEYNKRYNVEHADIKYNATSRRRCEQYNVEYVEDVDRMAVYGRDEGHCRGCRELVSFDKAEVDHIVSLSRGGVHAYYNVQTLCSSCNKTKAE